MVYLPLVADLHISMMTLSYISEMDVTDGNRWQGGVGVLIFFIFARENVFACKHNWTKLLNKSQTVEPPTTIHLKNWQHLSYRN